jgi:radical SAM-linked protein
MGQILRAVRQAEVPVLFSQGFNPRAKISFSPACPTGIESLGEYFEIECEGKPDARDLAEKLGPLLPEEIFILDADEVPWKTPSVNELIQGMRYRVLIPESVDREALRADINAFMENEEYLVAVKRKRKKRVLDARRQVLDIGISGQHLAITNRFQSSGSMKISEILALFFPFEDIRFLQIRKEETLLCPCLSA